jgi:transposase-like protein
VLIYPNEYCLFITPMILVTYYNMPRIQQKKKGIRSNWSENNMKSAIKLVLEQRVSERRAAKDCGIPRQTLRRYLAKARSGVQFTLKEKLGKKAVLTAEQEKELVHVLLDMERRFGVSVEDV